MALTDLLSVQRRTFELVKSWEKIHVEGLGEYTAALPESRLLSLLVDETNSHVESG